MQLINLILWILTAGGYLISLYYLKTPILLPQALMVISFILIPYSIILERRTGTNYLILLFISINYSFIEKVKIIWEREEFLFSPSFMTRSLSILVLILSLYFAFFYYRAWETFKRSRGNHDVRRKPPFKLSEVITALMNRIKGEMKQNKGIYFEVGLPVREEDLP